MVPGLTLAQTANVPAEQPCQNVGPGETVVLPLEPLPARGLWLVRVTVNGKPGRLALDTGAGQTTISYKLAGISERDYIRETKALRAEASTHTWVTLPARLTLALGAQVERRVVQLADFDEVSRLAEATIDGVLGTDVLAEFGHVAIDFRARTLTLGKPRSASKVRETTQ